MEAILIYPVQATASIPTRSSGLLVANERIDYVEDHLWQDAGGSVQVVERRGEQVLVRPPTKIVPQGRPALKRAYETWIPCSGLQLAPFAVEPKDGFPGLNRSVLLHNAPNGQVVAELGASGDPVKIQKQDGDWIHVLGLDDEYRYDGWVSSGSIQQSSLFPRFDHQEPVVAPSHRAARDTGLSLSHKLTDEGIVLPRGQLVYVAETRDGVSRVFLPHLRLLQYGSFFSRTEDLEAL